MVVLFIKCTWSMFWAPVSKPFVGLWFWQKFNSGQKRFPTTFTFYSIFLAFQSKNEGWHLVRMYLSNVFILAVLLNKFTNFISMKVSWSGIKTVKLLIWSFTLNLTVLSQNGHQLEKKYIRDRLYRCPNISFAYFATAAKRTEQFDFISRDSVNYWNPEINNLFSILFKRFLLELPLIGFNIRTLQRKWFQINCPWLIKHLLRSYQGGYKQRGIRTYRRRNYSYVNS